jgi:hydroxyacid-oxoacid transhydrogenase
MKRETAFEILGSTVRFGPGVSCEAGADLADLGVRTALIVADPRLVELPAVASVLESLEAHKIAAVLFDRVQIEPTDQSLLEAVAFGIEHPHDGLVAIGGGSTIDTAKAINLYTTYPVSDFFDYVNAPIGKGWRVPGPLKPLVAIPTTSGTGSETTGVAIFDVSDRHVKTGISSRRLKPAIGLLDPNLTRTLPAEVAASTGLDVLSHAVESFTAIPYSDRPAAASPDLRPPYQGSNPISDVWCLEALRMIARSLTRAVDDPSDDEARAQMLLAATYAGIGFGNAGVHLPHAMSYPVAGHVKQYRHHGYPSDHPLVPHGVSVIVNAPAVFRFTAPAHPGRHLAAAEALGVDISRRRFEDAGRVLADRIGWFMQRVGMPNGLNALGYRSADISALVEGTLLQERLTQLSPRPVTTDDLARLFEESMKLW